MKAIVFILLGMMIASLGMGAFEAERRPADICVPLYDKLPLECTHCTPSN